MTEALYTPGDDGLYRPSELTRGPWDPAAQHGGAPAALLAGLVGRAEPGAEMRVARLTYELLRPVPLDELRAEAEVIRPGRRVQLVEARLHAGDALVVRALAVRVRRAPGASPEVAGGDEDAPPAGPGEAPRTRFVNDDGRLTTFASDAMDIRFVEGAYDRPAGDRVVRAARARGARGGADARAARGGRRGLRQRRERGARLGPLAVHQPRASRRRTSARPRGRLDRAAIATRIATDGSGSASRVLYDERGRVGRAVQALLVQER